MLSHLRRLSVPLSASLALAGAFLLLPCTAYAGSPQVWAEALTVRFDAGDADCSTASAGTDESSIATCNGGAYDDMRLCSARILYDKPLDGRVYPSSCLKLCVQINCLNNYVPLPDDYPDGAPFEINSLKVEIFKYNSNTVPWNTTTAPAIQQVEFKNVGTCNHSSSVQTVATKCFGWSGLYNIDSTYGKLNGQYGFRSNITVAQTSAQLGTFNITDSNYYPGITQYPITMDVTNIHASSASPTLIGNSSPISALPYYIKYRISKDALTSITIKNSSGVVIRNLLTSAPRVGDSAGLSNNDAWDGLDNNSEYVDAGDYIATINAVSNNDWGNTDTAAPNILSLAVDPLRMTDFAVSGLKGGTTQVAAISYVLTAPATVYTLIYPPGTTVTSNVVPPTASASPVRTISENKYGRTNVATYWDGRDDNGVVLEDGDYVYAIYARMPGGTSGTIFTQKVYTGVVPLARGIPGSSQIAVGMGMLGSSPTITALRPFSFSYVLDRDAYVTFNILTSTSGSQQLVRQLVRNEVRAGGASNFINKEYWDGNNDDGYPVGPGNYVAELKAIDPLFYQKNSADPSKWMQLSTQFSVDMFRVTNVDSTPLRYATSTQSNAYAYIMYTPSETMYDVIKIYKPGTIVNVNTWPPVMDETQLVYTIEGTKAGKVAYYEPWNGYQNNTTILPDGLYVFTLTAKPTSQVAIYDTSTSPYYTLSSNVYATDRTYGYVEVTRGAVSLDNLDFSPSTATAISGEVVEIPPYEISFAVSRVSSVTISIQSPEWCGSAPYSNNICRTVQAGKIYDNGKLSLESWDGKDDFGNYLNAGAYTLVAVAYDYPDPTLQPATTLPMAIDIMPFQIYGLTVSDIYASSQAVSPAYFQFNLSVPMKVAIQIFKPGTKIDVNGNPDPPISSGSLVKALVSVEPATSGYPVERVWDGTDLAGEMVPDGHYVFRVVNSTDSRLVDSVTGEIYGGNKSYVADYRFYNVANIVTVTLGYPVDSQSAFTETVSFYPNPLRIAQGTFRINRLPFAGNYSLRIYNLAGDLVRSKDFGYQVPSSNYPAYEWVWDRKNEGGRSVARGIYFGVVEGVDTRGSKGRVQKVVKILIP